MFGQNNSGNNGEKEYTKYDSKLMKRLLSYAKPYLAYIAVTIIVLFGVVALELYQPILLGKAVDGFISNYRKNYTMVDESEIGSIHIRDYYLKKVDNTTLDKEKAKIIFVDDKYYLIPNMTNEEFDKLGSILKEKPEDIDIIEKDYETILLYENDLKIIRNDDIKGIAKLAILYAIVVIVASLLTYIQTLILQITGQKIIYNIRMEVFSHVQTLSINFFNKNPIGKLVTRVTNDTESLNEMYTSVIVNTLKSIFILVGIIIIMVKYNSKLALITFVVIPFIIMFTLIFRKVSRKFYRDIRGKLAGLNAFISEHISGMKIVQIFAVEEEVFNKFDNSNNGLKKAYLKQLYAFSIYRPSMYLLNITALALLIGFGGKMVIQGAISIGTIVIFQRYIGKFFEPIQELSEQFNILQSAMASSERIFKLLDTEPEIKDNEDTIDISNIKGEIEFKNVWFAYNENEWILKDVSFKIDQGETAAFVGATGAGKTTIQNLICRYYDIQKGEILIDGINIKDIKIEDLRQNIGQMLQDVFVFTGDISSNIRLRNEEITDEEILESSKMVNAHHFISKLKNTYKEEVFERGATFSAGERQLLSFARTLAFKPSVLILDEATANIDTETETLIQDALTKIMKNRTTLVVAHRLSTIQKADKIIVMHKGQIRETGSHQELLKNKGIYYNLYKLQYENS